MDNGEGDVFVLVKAIYDLSSTEPNVSPSIQIGICSSPMSDHIVLNGLTRVNNRLSLSTISRNKTDQVKWFALSPSNAHLLHRLNDYWRLGDAHTPATLRFPINMMTNDSSLFVPCEQTLYLPATLSTVKNTSMIRCHWAVGNVNTSIECSEALPLSDSSSTKTSFSHQHPNGLVFYPMTSTAAAAYRLFSRVLDNNASASSSSSRCDNAGVWIERSAKCLCWPGFGGARCQVRCPRGRLGAKCQYECPPNGGDGQGQCRGYLVCVSDPLGCSCASGWRGFACNETCAAGRWGPSCRFACASANDRCEEDHRRGREEIKCELVLARVEYATSPDRSHHWVEHYDVNTSSSSNVKSPFECKLAIDRRSASCGDIELTSSANDTSGELLDALCELGRISLAEIDTFTSLDEAASETTKAKMTLHSSRLLLLLSPHATLQRVEYRVLEHNDQLEQLNAHDGDQRVKQIIQMNTTGLRDDMFNVDMAQQKRLVLFAVLTLHLSASKWIVRVRAPGFMQLMHPNTSSVNSVEMIRQRPSTHQEPTSTTPALQSSVVAVVVTSEQTNMFAEKRLVIALWLVALYTMLIVVGLSKILANKLSTNTRAPMPNHIFINTRLPVSKISRIK